MKSSQKATLLVETTSQTIKEFVENATQTITEFVETATQTVTESVENSTQTMLSSKLLNFFNIICKLYSLRPILYFQRLRTID